MPTPDLPVTLSDEVREAQASGRAVVALESTIIAHGLPRPDNLDVGRALEATVREAGAVPATIAVLDGRLHAGLDDAELRRVAEEDMPKLSRRDLALTLARGGSGATTVAATMIGAHLAGIRVFATGGIGGVHRGAETSFDVSADLQELARTPVAVVCAGAKSILDLPKTLEVLETLGVPLIGYGTDELPAFYTQSSGLGLTLRADTPSDVADMLAMGARMELGTGSVIAVPIPEADALDTGAVSAWIEAALLAADAQGVTGKAVTPFLLQHLAQATGGAALKANVALARNNARVAAEIAAALADRTG
ncbi:MAG: pseudouridine-5'-phosphate glycosidase [Pseudomonadota bacterium]